MAPDLLVRRRMRPFLVSVSARVARTAVACVLIAAGCARAPVVQDAAEKPPPAAAVAAAPPPPAPGCSSDRDCRDGQLCIRGACVDISLGLAECRMFRVQFAFNAADFAPESKDALARIARCLRADQAMRLSIEGNADERGTEEYNLQLASRRASSVEKYLLALGVTAAQVKTVSYGENKPLCVEQDEACWAKNRRASVKPALGPGAKP